MSTGVQEISVVVRTDDMALNRSAKQLNKFFFPKSNGERNRRIDDLALLRLQYLALIPTSLGKSPFTAKQITIIHKSYRKECQVYWGLRLGLLTSVVTTLGLAYLGFSIKDDSSDGLKGGVYTAAAVVTTGLVVLSFWATGFAPNASSNTFNDQQDALLEMEETYEDLAYRLTALYFSTQQAAAIQLARQIDTDQLKTTISHTIHNRGRGRHIMARLEEAVRYIKSDGVDLPENVRFRYFIRDRVREGGVRDGEANQSLQT